MIIKQVLHTYHKETFPLIANAQHLSMAVDLDALFKDLISELSRLEAKPLYRYITRHDNGKIPNERMSAEEVSYFTKKFVRFINSVGKATFDLPNVWLVVYSETHELIESIKDELKQKNIDFYEDGVDEYPSVENIPPDNYARTTYEASHFPIYLHQVTEIGIDLLSAHDATNKLEQLTSLEWMQHTDLETRKSEIGVLKKHLSDNSDYYRSNIQGDEVEEREFWLNFQRVYFRQNGFYSWPHFLFNICGVHAPKPLLAPLSPQYEF